MVVHCSKCGSPCILWLEFHLNFLANGWFQHRAKKCLAILCNFPVSFSHSGWDRREASKTNTLKVWSGQFAHILHCTSIVKGLLFWIREMLFCALSLALSVYMSEMEPVDWTCDCFSVRQQESTQCIMQFIQLINEHQYEIIGKIEPIIIIT